MTNLLSAVVGVFIYIIIGYIIKKLNILPHTISKIFDYLSFNILLPIALITNFWLIEFPNIIVYNLIFAFFGAGIIVFALGFFISKNLYQFKTDDSAIFGLGACFGNSVAFGIPLMYLILGPVNAMPYMILVLFHGIIHFTYTTLIIEYYRNRSQSNIRKIIKTLIGLAKNIVLFGMFVGFILNYTNTPFPETLQNILKPIAKIALSTVLVSLGIGLGGFKITKTISYTIILTGLKNFIHPLIAFILAKYILLLSPLLVFIVTIAAALPSGSQTYYFSYRYNSLQNIISANVVVSTFVSFFTLSAILLLLNY
jgi:predicted permease